MSESQCQACPEGFWPNANKTGEWKRKWNSRVVGGGSISGTEKRIEIRSDWKRVTPPHPTTSANNSKFEQFQVTPLLNLLR